jgi:protein TonB
MFEDSLIESGGKLRTKRGKTTTFAVILQVVIIIVMILIPLVFTEALPKGMTMTFLVAPPPPPPPPPPPAAVKIVKQVQTDIINGQLRTPTKIPKKVEIIKEEEAPPPMTAGVVGGVPGGVPGGSMGGVMGSIIGGTPVAVPKVAVQRVRVSAGVTQGMLIRKVTPTYPPLARTARVQGTVLLAAIIDKDGSVANLHVISGHPLLTQAALDAVKQWRYKPYILNGEPVQVDTQVTVNFTLSGS